ncbi:MAG: ribonuclease P protein component [Clostridiales bacterium]|nr:ribonuclease P protein component [Clostridiales bacterium]
MFFSERCYVRNFIPIKSNRDFSRIHKTGASYRTRSLVMLVAPSKQQCTVLKDTAGTVCAGFSLSKKVGNAVVRNRIKRRLKEALMCFAGRATRNVSVVFIVRSFETEPSFAALCCDMEYLLKKAGIIL